MTKTHIVTLMATISFLLATPVAAGTEYLRPRSQGDIRALEIQLQIRIHPEKDLWYRIQVVEEPAPGRTGRTADPAATAPEIQDSRPSPAGQLKNGIAVVRAIRSAAVSVVKHFLGTLPTSPKGE